MYNKNIDIKKEVLKNIDVLYSQIDFQNSKINIHINYEKGEDYPRMAFVLFSLSRAYKNKFLDQDKKQELLKLFFRIYEQVKLSEDKSPFLFVMLYGMRMFKNLDEDYNFIIEDFKEQNYSPIYNNTIMASIFMSCFTECDKLRTGFDYSQEIFLQCKKIFDYIIFSNKSEDYEAFYFSELSTLEKSLPSYTLKATYKLIEEKFSTGYLQRNVSATGVAKCMEDFARRGESQLFNKCIKFLEQRKLSRFSEYLRPDQEVFKDNLFTENNDSQYICLDTNVHLLNTYLNIYEKNN